MPERKNVSGRSRWSGAGRSFNGRARRAIASASVAVIERLEERRLLAAQLVSATPIGTVADLGTTQYTLSANGRYVAFTSAGSDFVTGRVDDNFTDDIYWRDTQTGVTRMVSQSVSNINHSANNRSIEAKISADGQYVAFLSQATDLVAGLTDANGSYDVFLYSVASGTVSCISVDPTGTATLDAGSIEVAMRDNGLHVAFVSAATNVDAAVTDANGVTDIFLRDVVAGTTKVVSVDTTGLATATGASSNISINGQAPARVAFVSAATDLVAALSDTNGANDVFVYDSATDTVIPVSVMPSNTVTGNDVSSGPVISFNGNVVVYLSMATDLVGAGIADANSADDVFAFDVTTRVKELVSVAVTGTDTADAAASSPTLDDDGSAVAWVSAATNLEVGTTDTLGFDDVFLRDRRSGITLLASRNSWNTLANESSSAPTINYNGSRIAFLSRATNLAPNVIDTAAPPSNDVFARDLINRSTRSLSTTPDNTTAGNTVSTAPQMARQERAGGTGAFYVYFISTASNLVAGDFNFAQDLFRGQSRAKQVPAAPINVQGAAASDTTVDLSWTDNSIDEAKFKVLRSSDGVNFDIIAKVPANTTEGDTETYTDTGLIVGQTYYYRILATNDQGDSDFASTLGVNMPRPAVIAGTVWGDKNMNGAKDAGESGVAGVLVWADLDSDGSFTAGEPNFISDVNGNYMLVNVPAGAVSVVHTPAAGYITVSPANGSQIVAISAGQVVRNANFFDHNMAVNYALDWDGRYVGPIYQRTTLDALAHFQGDWDGVGGIGTLSLHNFAFQVKPWTVGTLDVAPVTLTQVGTTNHYEGVTSGTGSNGTDSDAFSSVRVVADLTINAAGDHYISGEFYAIDANGNRKKTESSGGLMDGDFSGWGN